MSVRQIEEEKVTIIKTKDDKGIGEGLHPLSRKALVSRIL